MTEKIFGSNVDWLSQHSVFPEYFRQQFYETGTVFPEFAANIGGGQNIYNFAIMAYISFFSSCIFPALCQNERLDYACQYPLSCGRCGLVSINGPEIMGYQRETAS